MISGNVSNVFPGGGDVCYSVAGEKMLEKIRIINYKSILDTSLSLSYTKKRAGKRYRENDTMYFIGDAGRRSVPFLVMYGANSSGKSTLLSALMVLKNIIRDGVGKAGYYPNRLAPGEEGTSFFITAVLEGKKYDYSLSYMEGEILSESLSADGEAVFLMDKGKLIKGEVDSGGIIGGGRQLCSLLSRESGNGDVRTFAVFILDRLLFFNSFRYSVSDAFSTFVRLSGKTREECMESVREFSKKLDLSIYDIEDGEKWKTEHLDGEKNKIWFSLDEESEGTKRLFALVSIIFASLSSGAVLIADEIDVSLHSIVLRVLVNLFASRVYNSSNAQLVCSAHNTDLLDAPYITSDEIAFFEKTRKKGSVITRLSEMEGVGRPSSYRRKYLEGGFSGIPFPYL